VTPLATLVPLQAVALLLVAVGGAAVVLTRDLRRLAVLLSVYGFTLVILFLVFQAPDVALSELVVGAVAFPLVVVVALVLARERGE
jgi:energy-converting hydrogenase B subunit D